jgi:PAS domain S-box-containing protein
VQALLGEFAERLCRLTGADGIVVFSFRDSVWRSEKVLGPLLGHPSAYQTFPGGMIEHALAAGHPVRLAEVTVGWGLSEVLESRGVRDALSVVCRGGRGDVLGAFVLHALCAGRFTDAQVAQATVMGEAMSAVLERHLTPEVAELNRQASVETNELRFRAFMAAVPAATWIKDETGRYLFLNENFTRLFHGGRHLPLATDFDFLPETIARAVRSDDDLVRAGSTVLSREEDVPTADGAMHTWSTTKFPIVDPSGRMSVGGIAFDITEQRAAQRALQEAEHELEHVVDLLGDPVIIHRDGRIIYVNGETARVLGVSASQLPGRNLRDFMPTGEVPDFEAALRRAARGQLVTVERQMRRADGVNLIVEASVRQISFGGTPAVLSVLRDVTERRAASQRVQLTDRLAAIGTLAAGVAHEINNPLAYVLSNLSMLTELIARDAPDEQHELACEALDGAERIKRIVEGMRTLARPSDPQRRAQLSLGHAIGHAIDLAGNELKHRARLELDLRPLPRVLGDETALVQVFVNLLTNAAQAIAPGSSEAHVVRVRGLTRADGAAQVSVEDDGSGMTPEVLARVFDPFFTTKTVNDGTGLGLSISHGIVASHGGELTAESQRGKGSRFTVTLPAAPPGSEVPLPTATPPPAVWRRRRVLVIDDDQLVARSLARLMGDTHDVRVLTRPGEAAALVQTEPFDVVLCDVMMPGLDGPALYARLPEAVRARFIFITGGAFTAEAEAFLAQQSNPVLRKPFDREQLLRLVDAVG